MATAPSVIQALAGLDLFVEHAVRTQLGGPLNDLGGTTFSLAEALLLPNQAPAAELQVLRGFLMGIRDFFMAVEQQMADCGQQGWQPDALLYNERDDETRERMGLLSCRIWQNHQLCDHPQARELAGKATVELQGVIAKSQVLTAFMANVERELSRHGEWSWFCLHEPMLFGQEPGPHTRRQAQRALDVQNVRERARVARL